MNIFLKAGLVTVILLVAGCTSPNGNPWWGYSSVITPSEAVSRVERLPNTLSRRVSLAVINHPATQFRVDQHQLPAWTWRDGQGNDGFGGCVHIHPETGEPYLETQFAKDERPAAPLSPTGVKPTKYIQFNLAGPWYARWHKLLPREAEENWTSPEAHQDGVRLLKKLDALLRDQ